jgi:DNA polymerase (family 10)
MNEEFAALARKSGVNIVISTDSHKYNDFYCMQLGVAIARRAWCEAETILNTRTWEDIKHITLKKANKRIIKTLR